MLLDRPLVKLQRSNRRRRSTQLKERVPPTNQGEVATLEVSKSVQKKEPFKTSLKKLVSGGNSTMEYRTKKEISSDIH